MRGPRNFGPHTERCHLHALSPPSKHFLRILDVDPTLVFSSDADCRKKELSSKSSCNFSHFVNLAGLQFTDFSKFHVVIQNRIPLFLSIYQVLVSSRSTTNMWSREFKTKNGKFALFIHEHFRLFKSSFHVVASLLTLFVHNIHFPTTFSIFHLDDRCDFRNYLVPIMKWPLSCFPRCPGFFFWTFFVYWAVTPLKSDFLFLPRRRQLFLYYWQAHSLRGTFYYFITLSWCSLRTFSFSNT